VTGAADDDPSGIATYSQSGAQFGYALSWTMFLTTTLAGLIAALSPFNPIRMLFWSAVVNGVVAVPLMAAMMLVVGNRKIMGAFAASRMLMIFGWAATAPMTAVVAAMLIANFAG
jgi:Mn2+/Fe2+ NRAMP family transporter